jgi:tRNA(fMet)-specific endonuclease VapC
MSLYVLDTDHLSLYRYGHPKVSAHIEATPADQLAVTLITIEKQLRAWYTQIRRARDRDQLARAYQGLFEVAETAKYIRVLPFTSRAIERYLDLRARLPRLGKMDLSIAAITLERRFPRSEILQQSGMRLRRFCPDNQMTCDCKVDRFILPRGRLSKGL